MTNLLHQKVAIITGTARGIGQAAAELFAQHGARVVMSDIDAQPLNVAAEAIRKMGGNVLPVAGDVTDPAFPEKLVKTALEKFGALDILVNNAGYTWDAVIHKMTDQQWQAILDCHLTAPFRIIRAASEYWRENAKDEQAAGRTPKARKIVNISSTSGTRGNPGQANYSAGKAGIIGLTKTLAREWGQFNIQSNAVAFGWIDTRLTRPKEKDVKIERENMEIQLGIPASRRDNMPKLIPMGRAGTPQEAAGAVLFFASPLSDYVSGQVLEVTGGL
ncbi:MAG TPA: SDR family oxidoreductase [Candidatus Angelobacter sp.]|jgi:3-oxoacyl-[acyl-carrier protein] reductase|nr:SDR family oxidoreductase [Candidatus Angelobacter sp.]